jgi:hypothetical protein
VQESRGKFDLKEPYYRQQVQWMMAAAAAAPGEAAAPAAAQPAVVQGSPVVAVPLQPAESMDGV